MTSRIYHSMNDGVGAMTARKDSLPAGTRATRRKACDLCFTKKIKCDMVMPTCSNCVLYKTECTTGKCRKKMQAAVLPRPTLEAPPPPSLDTAPASNTEDRLSRIERQLEQLVSLATSGSSSSGGGGMALMAPGAETGTGAGTGTGSCPSCSDTELASVATGSGSGPGSGSGSCSESDVRLAPQDRTLFDVDAARPPWQVSAARPDDLPVAPMADILPIVAHYFAQFNRVVALFDETSFMRALRRWYADPGCRTRAFWAAIQVVMAISLRTPTPEHLPARGGRGGRDRHQRAGMHLKAAQSAVSELVMRDQDLLGIQVLLGIVILFQNSSDPSPASVIIGTAVRLAHRMQLSSRRHADLYAPDENRQRERVFWIAYQLDKDISLRIKVPSVQSDVDVDLPLPDAEPADRVGIVCTADGAAHVNYTRLAIGLAQIEGRLYDGLLSNCAARQTPDKRRQRVGQIDAMLDQWYANVPPPFTIPRVARAVGPVELAYMTKLYHTYLLLLVMAYGVYNENANWVRAIRSADADAIKDLAMGMAAAVRDPPEPPLAAWSKCVRTSRGCLQLFGDCRPTECLVWHCSCPNFCGMTILLANIVMDPTHEHAVADMALAEKAIALFDKAISFMPEPEVYSDIRHIVGELYDKAAAKAAAAAAAAVGHGGHQEDHLDLYQTLLLDYNRENSAWNWPDAAGMDLDLDSIGIFDPTQDGIPGTIL